MSYEWMLTLIVALPLLGGILNGFFLRNVPRTVTTIVATACVAIPFFLGCALLMGPIYSGSTPVSVNLFNWISLKLVSGTDFVVPFSLTVDRLSATLVLIITGIGSLIHIYAGEYMHSEKGVYRFFAYLNLFVFSMLCLVLGSNMLVTFLGWEGVGVCSYLLIGYWYEEEANAAAGMKAFIANRVGDFGFLMAMFLSLTLFGSIGYSDLASKVGSLPPEWFAEHNIELTLLGLSVLLGVTGKSAQLPLYIWLPDAMAGPTPVSALIHAATMVTAGIYLMTRMSFLLVHMPVVMYTIATIGGLTALFAATIGLVQNDIKKVLAYSTVSQLGFMVMACGVGAFQYGVAHLMTHAFFKALLFLGAGSVIHAMHHEQDIRKMGGLLGKLPITGITFIIGTLAIIGVPGFSGFFSKDEILYYSWSGTFGSPVFWAMGAAAAACTSFYMVRLTTLVFFGQSRVDHHTAEHLHENPLSITVPLMILAVLAIVGGYISLPHAIMHVFGMEGDNLITKWLAPVTAQAFETMKSLHGEHHGSSALEWTLMGVSTAVMLLMSVFAFSLYKAGPQGGDRFAKMFGPFYPLVLDKWRVDELYQLVIINPLKCVGDIFYKVGDRFVIEGIVNNGPKLLRDATAALSGTNSGLARTYLKLMFVALILLGLFLFV